LRARSRYHNPKVKTVRYSGLGIGIALEFGRGVLGVCAIITNRRVFWVFKYFFLELIASVLVGRIHMGNNKDKGCALCTYHLSHTSTSISIFGLRDFAFSKPNATAFLK